MKNVNNKDLYEYTENKIMSHYQNSSEFNKKFIQMEKYYHLKLASLIKEKDKEKFKERFFGGIKAQFFNGYYIIQEVLSLDDTKLEDNWLIQPEGYITQQVPKIIRDITNENEEAIYSPEMRRFKMWMITTYEDVLEEINQTAFDVLCLGANQALLDIRDKRGLVSVTTNNVEIAGKLASYNDISFITPQVFLEHRTLTNNAEIWNMSFWDSINTSDSKAGEVSIITIPQGEDNVFDLNIMISNRLSEVERKDLVEAILYTFMENNNIKRDSIILHFAVVEDFFILVQE